MLCLSEEVHSVIGTGEKIEEFRYKGSLLGSFLEALLEESGKCVM
jgi:hypothetical protein